MPPPYRRPPEVVGQDAEIPSVDADLTWRCIQEIVPSRLSGGAVYDAAIARAAFGVGASVLLTGNLGDFLRVAPAGLEITTPPEFGGRATRVH